MLGAVNVFTSAELAYLSSQKLGRLATVGPDGAPQVRPVGFAVDAQTGAIDIGGLDNPATQKWRNVVRDGRVAFVVDDLAPGGGWHPRALEVRGYAEVLPEATSAAFPGTRPGLIRIHPVRVLASGIEEGVSASRRVAS
jgi:pyridoxamine 5'-phosphate oxidase family protein